MDESLSRTVIDFSGRPELIWKVKLGLKKILLPHPNLLTASGRECWGEGDKTFSKLCEQYKCNMPAIPKNQK